MQSSRRVRVRHPNASGDPISDQLTTASLFGGGGGWDVGAVLGGARPLWSIEFDPAIAAVHDLNLQRMAPGHRTIVGDVRTVPLEGLERPDVLFTSPVCKAHSKGTSRLDMCDIEHAWSGTATLRYVEHFRPSVVALENVPDYVRHGAFQQIAESMARLGYHSDVRVVNACWFGTPSTRVRLLALWTLEYALRTPIEVRRDCPSWYEATRDLFPSFPPSRLAPWQWARVERMRERGVVGPYPWLVSSFNVATPAFAAGRTVVVARFANEPAWTVVASAKAQTGLRVLFEDGTVRSVTPRGLARMQGFPDEYELPTDPSLAITVIGNAVPPPIGRWVVRRH